MAKIPVPPHRNRKSVSPSLPITNISAADSTSPADGIQARVITDFEDWSKWRRAQANRLFLSFYMLNGLIFGFVASIWLVETFWSPRNDRIITERVVLALIAASAAQLGSLAWHAGRQLLRHPDHAVLPSSSRPST